ncbi:NUDIX hydrolase [Candidatus Gottesmanbacteria bacterium]|nr:NUDIX hydrolase [Candidatus Gottesmanbacteria bacterium]
MITCAFEDGHPAKLRHIVTHALVEKDGCLLLGKRRENMMEGGKWGLPGGFLDRDETLEQCVLREVLEETGWKGKVVSLFRINSNPNRPKEDRQNVAFDFIVSPLEKIGEGDNESTKVEWVPIEKLWNLDLFAFDHGESIKKYLEYRKKKFVLPLVF